MDSREIVMKLLQLSEDIVLPPRTKPVSAQRVKDIRDIVRRKYHLPLSLANVTAAALFGFKIYDEARSAAYDPEDQATFERADEDCIPEYVTKRRREQAEALVYLLSIEQAEADQLVLLLRPTSRTWTPSLRRQSASKSRPEGNRL